MRLFRNWAIVHWRILVAGLINFFTQNCNNFYYNKSIYLTKYTYETGNYWRFGLCGISSG